MAYELSAKFDIIAASPDKPFALVSTEEAAESARRLIGHLYLVTTWPPEPAAASSVDLGPLVKRKGLLIPANTPDARADMHAIAARLVEIGCDLRWTDTAGELQDWDLDSFNGTPDEFIVWAKLRTKPYLAPEPDMPPSEFPPEATNERPKRGTRPRLAAIDGNTALAPQEEAEIAPQPFSEDHLAHVFAERHGADWRYVKLWDRWFKWSEGWSHDATAEVFQLSRELCREAATWPDAAQLTPMGKRALGQRRIAGNVRDMAGSDRGIAATAEQWDKDPWLLGVPGGVIDLKTGRTLDARRDQYITKRTAIAPQQGPHPLWDKVLERASSNDKTMAHYLQKWAGYMLTGDTREEAFLFVHGPGGSGKSTFVQAIRDCMGTYATATRIETFMAMRHSEHPTEIADLAGARLVYAPETEEGARWNESRIKMFTGRDRAKARFMGCNFFEFDPVCKLMIFGNHRPRLHSVGEEMKRRIHMVEFPDSIPEAERDPALKVSIAEEYPAILAWMIEGCIAWQAEGLGRPEAVEIATDSYLSSQDTLGAWLEECCTQHPEAKCQVSGAYKNFEQWARARGEYVPSVTGYSEKMQARGFVKFKASAMWFRGFELKETEPASYTSRYPD